MRSNTVWSESGAEPELAEMMSDPLVHLVLARDGLTHDDLWNAVRVGRARLGRRIAGARRLDSAA